MAQITVTGQLLNGLDEPIVGEYVYFRVTGAGTDETNDVVYPRKTFTLGPSDSNGDLPSDTIWVNGDSGVQSYYEIRLPGQERVDVVIPSGTTGTIDLSTILTTYRVNSSTQQNTTLDDAKAYTDVLADDPTGNASFDEANWRAGLNLEIGTDVQAWDADLDAIAALAKTDGNFIVGNGSTWVGESGSTLRASIGTTLQNTIFVAKNGTDTRTGLDPHDIGNPFLTVNAALAAASSGDLIMVFPGDYSAESALAGADGVNWEFKEGAISPSFSISSSFTFTINGNIGNAFLTTGGNPTVTINGNVENYLDIGAGTIRLNGNLGSYVVCYGGSVTIKNSDINSSTFGGTIQINTSGSINIEDSKITYTLSGSNVCEIANSWNGSLFLKNCELIATTVATNEATKGINYGTGVTGSVQLKNCTIITAQNGTGTAKSIDAPSAQTVIIQGSLNQTHTEDADITFDGGPAYTNTSFDA